MNIESHILPRPLTNAQARQGVNLMKRMDSERAEADKALRERVDLGNLAYYLGNLK